jgi:Skp family chaperone for outer membrane proteins
MIIKVKEKEIQILKLWNLTTQKGHLFSKMINIQNTQQKQKPNQTISKVINQLMVAQTKIIKKLVILKFSPLL